jgi:hypothetical protein
VPKIDPQFELTWFQAGQLSQVARRDLSCRMHPLVAVITLLRLANHIFSMLNASLKFATVVSRSPRTGSTLRDGDRHRPHPRKRRERADRNARM